MSNMLNVLNGRKPFQSVPLWDLEFHPWHKFSSKPYRVGVEFTRLSEAAKEKAIHVNAEVVAEVPKKLTRKPLSSSPMGVKWWKRDGDQIRWEVTVPPNSTATALIPATDVATIRESGNTVAQSGLTATAGPCETTRVELPPGAYVFEFQRKNQAQPANP